MWVMKISNSDTACQGMWSAASKNTFRFKSPIWLSFDVETSKVINCLFTIDSAACLQFGLLLFTDNPSDPDPAKINQSKTAQIVKNLCRIYLSSK